MTTAGIRKMTGWTAVIALIASVVMFYPPLTRFIMYPLTFCLISGFFWIIENKKGRLVKGFDLICFGVMMGVAFPYILEKISKGGLSADLESFLEIYKNIAVLTCAGAGGGILANHAEHIAPKNDAAPVPDDADALFRKKLAQINILLHGERKQSAIHTRLLLAILSVLIVLCVILLLR